MKRIRVHSVEQYVNEIGPLVQKGLDMYRADVPEEGLLGVGFVGADTEVLISIREFKETGDLIKYGGVRGDEQPPGKKTNKKNNRGQAEKTNTPCLPRVSLQTSRHPAPGRRR